MGFLGWLKDKINDDTIDDGFVQIEEKFLEEWKAWAREREYTILAEIPDDILKASQKSPFIKCDKSKILFPLMKEHGQYNVYSYYLEKEFSSFFSSATHTYNCLVAAALINPGDGFIEMEAELKDLIGGGKKCLFSIDSDWKRYSFKINGEPVGFVRDLFTDEMIELFKSFDRVHMSYIDGHLFLIRPTPRLITRPRTTKICHPFRFEPDVDSVLELNCHRKWDAQCVKWIGQILDQLDQNLKK